MESMQDYFIFDEPDLERVALSILQYRGGV